MKKLICVLMSLLMVFSLTSCSVSSIIEDSNNSKVQSNKVQSEDKNQEKPNENKDDDPIKSNNNPASIGNVNNGVLKKAVLETMDVPQKKKTTQ